MSKSWRFDEQTGCLSIHGELTIYQSIEATHALRAAYDSTHLNRIDLTEVTELDTAGLQLLLLARRLSTKTGSVLLVNPSPAVTSVFQLAGESTDRDHQSVQELSA